MQIPSSNRPHHLRGHGSEIYAVRLPFSSRSPLFCTSADADCRSFRVFSRSEEAALPPISLHRPILSSTQARMKELLRSWIHNEAIKGQKMQSNIIVEQLVTCTL